MKEQKDICWIDIETTGLNKVEDRVIDIAMTKTTSDGVYIDSVKQRICPGDVKSTPEALAKHNITDAELICEPLLEDVADSIIEFIGDCDLGGHNCIKFDFPFLCAQFERIGKVFPISGKRIYDTYSMYYAYNKFTLADMYKQYCGNNEPDCTLHTPECDIQITIDLFNALRKKHDITVSDVDEMCGNNTRIDLDGKFTFFTREDGSKYVGLSFGKWKGVEWHKVDVTYYEWMYNNTDFSPSTKGIVQRILNKLKTRI